MYITDRPTVVMTRGEGMWLWDSTGQKYLDFIQGWAVNCLGHSPAIIADAITEQAKRLLTPSPTFFNDRAIELAGLIVRHSCFDKIFFANCGAEANEGAIKLARKWGKLHKDGAYEIITMDRSFHGRTLATMSASGKPQFRELFEPKVPGFIKVPLNDIDAVAKAISQRTVAVMIEPIQGEAGVYVAHDEYMRALRHLTAEAGILLIVDEIQTGIGRTGRLFGYEHSGISPDIMTLGKGLGGGVPLAAMVAKSEVSCFEAGDQGGTYNGNPLMTAVGCAVMRAITAPGFLEQVSRTGQALADHLARISAELGLGEVRGRGLLWALDLGCPVAKAVAATAMTGGLLINTPKADTLRFMPALNVTQEEIDYMVRILRTAIESAM
jgi:acetylornithine/N-succinyldiaminopimelate aminotransferase